MVMARYHRFFSLFFPKRWLPFILASLLALGFSLGLAQLSQAQSWLDLLFQGVQVLQLSNLSSGQEVRLGQQINQQLLQQGQVRLARNQPLNRYIDQIGQRLARTSARPDLPYTFQVVNDRNINAFATMGGFVYVNSGLVAAAENEAELASVMAHEIAHISARHAVNRLRDVALSQGLMTAAGLQESTLVRLGVELAFNLPMSREAELEADSLGLRNLIQAGYAPLGMITFMQKLQRRGSAAPEFLSTHPLTNNRILALQRAITPQQARRGEGLDPAAYQAQLQQFR
ncbi:M48 family metallopeptidase [Synechocystis sp. LKSZ1]|uniref:M48 family metallopeptidase n=1 Tax=Synechocystis sp. LKSZ1 TaxID=3144951 RepID=UPI00336C1FB8